MCRRENKLEATHEKECRHENRRNACDVNGDVDLYFA